MGDRSCAPRHSTAVDRCRASRPPTSFLEVRDLRIHFPTDDGAGQVRRRAVVPAGARPHARHRGRVGLRQERDQPRHPRACTTGGNAKVSGEIWLDGAGARRRVDRTRCAGSAAGTWR